MTTKTDQITLELRRRLSSGEYHEGDKIESFAQLQRRYGVDGVWAIQSALAPLRDEGILRGEHGRGVFVQHLPSPRPETDVDETDVLAVVDTILAGIVAEVAQLRSRLEAVRALLAKRD
jgi:DNA-binding GntR family transcriptional regulator